jgi:hypothetical protein
MSNKTTKSITAENNENEFQVRFLEDEGVGLLTTKTGINYLVLDSLDYWYDLIQDEYPKKKKCKCKNEWFTIKFTYTSVLNSEDIKEVEIETTCTSCKKKTMAMTVEIDYAPTNELFNQPIIFCEQPKIIYKYSELTGFWTDEDLIKVFEFIFSGLKLNVYGWYFQLPEKIRRFEKLDLEKVKDVLVHHNYIDFYFAKDDLKTEDYINNTTEIGIALKNDIWRKNEIIELSAINMSGIGEDGSEQAALYYLEFCNQHIVAGEVQDKSEAFEAITNQLLIWLKENFISKRGKNCYDSLEAYNRVYQ